MPTWSVYVEFKDAVYHLDSWQSYQCARAVLVKLLAVGVSCYIEIDTPDLSWCA